MPLSELTTESFSKLQHLLGIGGITIFVAACFILLYWPVIDSFLPLLKQGYLFNLLLLRHFALLNFGGTAQNETGFPYMC